MQPRPLADSVRNLVCLLVELGGDGPQLSYSEPKMAAHENGAFNEFVSSSLDIHMPRLAQIKGVQYTLSKGYIFKLSELV